jgi:hypothetical protein
VLILDRLLAGLRATCTAFPDKRKSEGVYSMAGIGLSAFSLFFMQSESFLSYQRSQGEGRKTSNCHTLFGMATIPTDNHIRSMLDPVHASHLQGCFDQAVAALGEHGGLKAFQRLDRRTLIALDGTEYFCSQKLGCPHCQMRKRSNGKVEFYHSMLAATVVAPGHNMVLPPMPEFIVKPDGAEKQDCERNAAKRWLAAHGERMKDRLRSIWAMISSPANRSAKPCFQAAAIRQQRVGAFQIMGLARRQDEVQRIAGDARLTPDQAGSLESKDHLVN